MSSVLIVCASRGGLEPHTEDFVAKMRFCGARCTRSRRCSDVTLHRCIISKAAEQTLETDHSKTWVLWLDADIGGDPLLVEQLLMIATAVNEPIWDAGELEREITICGGYRKADGTNMFAGVRLPPDVETRHEWIEGRSVALEPVYFGMGAFLMTRHTFLRIIRESPQVQLPNGTYIPAVTGSGVERRTDGSLCWGSDDYTYCAWLWEHSGGVYLAPVGFGHKIESVVYPDGATVLDGQLPALDFPEAPHA